MFRPLILLLVLLVRLAMALALDLLPSLAAAQQVQILHRFTPSPGEPSGPLVQAPDGSFYGPLLGGGICRLAPGGQVTVTPGPTNPRGRLVLGADGGLYGTTGAQNGTHGAIFRFDPVTLESRTMHIFTGANEGWWPVGGLVDVGGHLFGVTSRGPGDGDLGTLFRFDPSTGSVTMLHHFSDAVGAPFEPTGPLALGPDGRLYGTTRRRGPRAGPVVGTIDRFDPVSGALATVHLFTDAEGIGPGGPLLLDIEGRFYGAATGGGGADDAGTIFRFIRRRTPCRCSTP